MLTSQAASPDEIGQHIASAGGAEARQRVESKRGLAPVNEHGANADRI